MADKVIRTIRTPKTKDRPYFSMSRAAAQDERLSFEARGALAYILSKPDDWRVQIKDLQQKCGRDKVYAILKELQQFGYIEHERTRDAKGNFKWTDYRVYESPLPEKPDTVLPDTDNPDTAKADSIHSNESLQSTERQSKEQQKREKTKTPAPNDAVNLRSIPNPLFDVIALEVFDIKDASALKGSGSSIGALSASVKKLYTAEFGEYDAEKAIESVRRFAATFKSKGKTPPRYKSYFEPDYLAFLQKKRTYAHPSHKPIDPDEHITAADEAQIIANMPPEARAAFEKTMKAWTT